MTGVAAQKYSRLTLGLQPQAACDCEVNCKAHNVHHKDQTFWTSGKKLRVLTELVICNEKSSSCACSHPLLHLRGFFLY